jgi:hypothetical protein
VKSASRQEIKHWRDVRFSVRMAITSESPAETTQGVPGQWRLNGSENPS